MNYMRAYRFVFDSPKWMANLLAAAICVLVPVAGEMVLFGYGFNFIESLNRRKNTRAPDFDTNRLSEYLLRGLWPWLARFVASLPLGFVFAAFYLCFILGIAFAPDKQRSIVALVFIPLFFLVVIVLALVVNLVLTPITLRAGLTQEFGQAFSIDFAKDFIKRVWKETVLASLFLFASSFVLSLIGMMLCFVGLYPAMGLLMLAQFHLWHQLYELYLERGGTPIPLKADSAPDRDLPLVYEAPPSDGIQAPEEP
jgi:Protein of unknown function (DUF4013)